MIVSIFLKTTRFSALYHTGLVHKTHSDVAGRRGVPGSTVLLTQPLLYTLYNDFAKTPTCIHARFASLSADACLHQLLTSSSKNSSKTLVSFSLLPIFVEQTSNLGKETMPHVPVHCTTEFLFQAFIDRTTKSLEHGQGQFHGWYVQAGPVNGTVFKWRDNWQIRDFLAGDACQCSFGGSFTSLETIRRTAWLDRWHCQRIL